MHVPQRAFAFKRWAGILFRAPQLRQGSMIMPASRTFRASAP
jgi:hypothetical protein